MADHRLRFPLPPGADLRALRAGDGVLVDGHVVGIRDASSIRLVDERVPPPFPLAGTALLHTAPNVRRRGDGSYEPLSVGTTTSYRMSRFTEPLLRDHGVRAVVGKGGLHADALAPLRAHGAVYLALVGGAAALQTAQIEAIERVEWEDLMPECLWLFRVSGLGPLVVGMDAHGQSLYEDVQAEARRRLRETIHPRT